MVRAVVSLQGAAEVCCLGFASSDAVGDGARFETALEESPGNAFGVEEVSDVLARHADHGATAAIVVERVGVTDDGAGDDVRGIGIVAAADSVGLTRDEIDCSGGGGA